MAVMSNVCVKCGNDILRWEREGWSCYNCGHWDKHLKTISFDNAHITTANGYVVRPYESSLYIPTDYEGMRTFTQFIDYLEVT